MSTPPPSWPPENFEQDLTDRLPAPDPIAVIPPDGLSETSPSATWPPSDSHLAPEFHPPTFTEPPPLRPTPNFTDIAILFLIMLASIAVIILGTSVAVALWKAGHPTTSPDVLKTRALAFGIPLQMLWYLLIAAIAVPVFRRVWHRPFAEGIHWNGKQVAMHAVRFILLGVALSLVVSAVSSRLHAPPKDAPILELFQNRTLAWIATFFGVFVAPTAEELGFRGFLFPALQNRVGAILATILTSVLFALLHAGQLAHAWGPVAVLFFVSVVLCIVRLRTNSVAATALLHSSYNATLFLAMIVASGGYRHLEKLMP